MSAVIVVVVVTTIGRGSGELRITTYSNDELIEIRRVIIKMTTLTMTTIRIVFTGIGVSDSNSVCRL